MSARDDFVSGVFRSESEFKKPLPSIQEIANSALTKRRTRKKLRQTYSSERTPEIRRATNRMLGERDD